MFLIILILALFAFLNPIKPAPGVVRHHQATSVEATIPSAKLPFEVTICEGAETKARREVRNAARQLIQATNYAALEALAGKLRASKDRSSSGHRLLGGFYECAVISKHADESQWELQETLLQGWITAYPKSVTARVALANFLTEYAWKARGSGYANTVSETGWKLLKERLEQAQAVLDAAQNLPEKCPMTWLVQQTVDLGLNADREVSDAHFKQAVAFEPGFRGYYFSWAYNLLPRWNGAEGELETRLEQVANQVGGDDGDELYAQVVWYMGSTSTNVFSECHFSWPRVDRGFAIIKKQYPNSTEAINEHAHLAVLARDRANAKDYFDLTAGKADSSVWQSKELYVKFANWAYQEQRQ